MQVKRTNMKIPGMILIACFLSFVGINFLFADAEQSAHKFLRIPSDARAAGLGEACVALPIGVSIMNYNPAGLGSLEKYQFSLMHIEWLSDVQYEYFAYGHHFKGFGTAGINLRYMHMPGFDLTDSLGTKKGKLSASGFALTAGLGKKFGSFNGGFNIKFVKDTFQEYSQESISLDFGMMKEQVENQKLILGAALRNLGINFGRTGSSSDSLPLDIALGASSKFLQLGYHGVLCSLEAIFNKSFSPRVNTGIEYVYRNYLFARAGYKAGYSTAGFAFGIGVIPDLNSLQFMKKSKLPNINLQLDYSLGIYKDFGFNHYVSLSMTLLPGKKKTEDIRIEKKPVTEEKKEENIIIDIEDSKGKQGQKPEPEKQILPKQEDVIIDIETNTAVNPNLNINTNMKSNVPGTTETNIEIEIEKVLDQTN